MARKLQLYYSKTLTTVTLGTITPGPRPGTPPAVRTKLYSLGLDEDRAELERIATTLLRALAQTTGNLKTYQAGYHAGYLDGKARGERAK